MMRVLVTGGLGFVGVNLIPHLLRKKLSVSILDNNSRSASDAATRLSEEVKFYRGDIRDTEALDRAMDDVDAVIHLAAYGSVIESVEEPMTNFDVNAYGTLQTLAAAHRNGVDKFIFASTGGALIGDAEPPVNELSVPRPKSPYGASKLSGEAYCHGFSGTTGLKTIILRFANLYGPFSAHKRGAVTTFIKNILRDEPIVIYGDGTASRDFLHIDDLCKGITRALQTNLDGGTVLHLASGQEVTISNLAQTIIKAAGRSDHPIEYRSARSGEVYRNFATYDRAAKALNFKPKIGLQAGLGMTWDWYVEHRDAALATPESDS